jgi:Zn-dependent protease with chaperone function
MRWRRLASLIVAAAVSGACTTATGAPPREPSPSPAPRTGDPTRVARPLSAEQAARLQRLMVPLVKAMDNPKPLNQVKITVIDDPDINAANAGGGQFYVTRGLLERANDDQLLGVLAHEVAHDDLGHVAKIQLLGVGVGLGVILLDQLVPGSRAITPAAGELIVRGYSRQEEYAADRHGVELLRRIGRDKEVMVGALTWLLRTSGPSGGGFLSTHPATDDRIQALRGQR